MALQARRAGKILPLPEIERRVLPTMKGAQYIGVDLEMPSGVYDARWLPCATPHGPIEALAFTLSRRSPSFTGALAPEQYRHIFRHARGRYGSTLDYARQTHDSLRAHGVSDRRLAALLALADEQEPAA